MLAVLSTYNPESQQPYSSIIAFSHSEDLKHVFFATPKHSAKYYNLKLVPKVSILIDSRKNDGKDIGVASAITVLGNSRELNEKDDINIQCFLKKHPQLESFIESTSTAFISIDVSKYILVDRFQDVSELKVELND
jgi:pyridoxamine 5'-phosphate oxidase-like protein